jgi:lambda repressor-like predicted transcriptional regulator
MGERGLGLEELLAGSGLERKVLDAILQGRYTPSPQQRQRVAGALGVHPDEITWGHVNEVSHVYGHGPQFGRSP